jgi:hypothetical protein
MTTPQNKRKEVNVKTKEPEKRGPKTIKTAIFKTKKAEDKKLNSVKKKTCMTEYRKLNTVKIKVKTSERNK